MLSSKQDASFKALRATVLGDIMWDLGKKEAALKEYQAARDLSDGAFVPPRLMEKLSFLGANSPEANSDLNIQGEAENAITVSDESGGEKRYAIYSLLGMSSALYFFITRMWHHKGLV